MVGDIPNKFPENGAKRTGRSRCQHFAVVILAVGFWSLTPNDQIRDTSQTNGSGDVSEFSPKNKLTEAVVEDATVQVPPKISNPVSTQLAVKETARPVPRMKPRQLSMDSGRVQLASLSSSAAKIGVNRPKRITVPHVPSPEQLNRHPNNPAARKLEPKLFGSVELQFSDERRIKGWSRVYNRFVSDARLMKNCLDNSGMCEDQTMAGWGRELKNLQSSSRRGQLQAVNSLVNQFAHRSDVQVYGARDYWASPTEFLGQSGDCEDFALMKFASLMALGVEANDMRIVVATLPDGRPHAFLSVKAGAKEYILDNRQNNIFTSVNRTDYIPKYSLNLSSRWTHIMPSNKHV